MTTRRTTMANVDSPSGRSRSGSGGSSRAVQEEPEHPVSIKALMSRFESLSTGNDASVAGPSRLRPPTPNPHSRPGSPAVGTSSPRPQSKESQAPAVTLRKQEASPPLVVDSPQEVVDDDAVHLSVRSLAQKFGAPVTGTGTTSRVSPPPPRNSRNDTPPADSTHTSPDVLASEDPGESAVPPLLSLPSVKVEHATARPSKGPPPPPPISRSASPALSHPAPPQPNRALKPTPRPSPSATPQVSRRSSGPELGNNVPLSVPHLPPQLPARRPTKSSSDSTSTSLGPTPDVREAPKSPMMQSQSADAPSKPQLPARSRGISMGPLDKPGESSVPPRLPIRQATRPLDHNAGTARPAAASISLPPTPQRSRELPPANQFDAYQPPPPPSRTAAANGPVLSPPRRNGTTTYIRTAAGDMSSDEDEDEVEDQAQITLSATAKRLLDDYPDSTHANRRPPSFRPDVKLMPLHPLYSFATFGRYACTASHQVRVYDTQMGNQPIFSVDLRETGLEFRIKEPRVTAMCFRPAATLADEGRYLWCGTKDGHLWELDVKTGTVTDTRPSAHASAVVNIFRYKHFLLTLEESGRLHVFEVNKEGTSEQQQGPRLSRTVRISEKFTFAKMIGHRLWSATAPAVRSTTNVSSKGPTIRVYEPCSPGAMPAGTTLITSEWTGAVTSATRLPLRPNEVYLGHEGGFVSVWSNEDLTCLRVLKLSVTDILSLEGVGERLWAGNRKGQIAAYDVSETPWQTTNLWLGHPDHSIHDLRVDPWSMEHTGRFTCWSCSRESIRAWDGLLSVGWIDEQLIHRQPDYCSFRRVKLLVCSWNIDSAKPSDLHGSEQNALFLEECLQSVDSPDIVVFGFQEVIPLTDTRLTAKTLLFGSKSKDGSGGSGDKVTAAYRLWLDKLQLAVRMSSSTEGSYVKVHSENLVGLFTCIFVKGSEKDALGGLDICTVKRGIGNIYGNKGAIVARMVIDDTSICFINVHLAAGQRQKSARNADIAAIMEDKAILPPRDELPFVRGGDGTGILDHEMVIINGDLNYRIDQRRENVLSSVSAGEYGFLLEHDQLRKELKNNHAFRLRAFEEAPIDFAPTYKYNPNSEEYDSSEKNRIPAWCDRILYNKSECITNINYRRYEPTVSDHRPISAGFELRLKKVDRAKMLDVRREIGEAWAKREIELLGKMAEAYASLL